MIDVTWCYGFRPIAELRHSNLGEGANTEPIRVVGFQREREIDDNRAVVPNIVRTDVTKRNELFTATYGVVELREYVNITQRIMNVSSSKVQFYYCCDEVANAMVTHS